MYSKLTQPKYGEVAARWELDILTLEVGSQLFDVCNVFREFGMVSLVSLAKLRFVVSVCHSVITVIKHTIRGFVYSIWLLNQWR